MDLGERFIIRHSFIGDAITILKDLRNEDRREWTKSVDGGIERLYECIEASAECYSIISTEDNAAHIIFGVVAEPEPTVWLVGTNEGQREASWILHSCREFYDGLFQRWPKTVCYSDPDNKVHHRWLQWMGFRLSGEVPWGPWGLCFYEFRKEVP